MLLLSQMLQGVQHAAKVLMDQVGSPSTSAPEVVRGWLGFALLLCRKDIDLALRRPYGKPADMWSAGAA